MLFYGWNTLGGDSAGWALITLWPILLPAAFVAAVPGFVVAYTVAMRKLV